MSLQTAFHLNRLRRNLYRRTSDLDEMQVKKLRAIVRHAYENVSFYHRKFRDAGVKPDDVKSIEDLRKMPVTSKTEMQSISFQERVASNIDLNKCIQRRTSGSMGQPLTVIVDRDVAKFEEALWLRAMFENGLRLRDKIVEVHDPNTASAESSNWLQHFGIMRRRKISIFEDPHHQLRLIQKIGPEAIKGYPSALTLLANLCEKDGPCSVRPRMIFTGAELLDGGTRKLISSAFDAEVLDNYGCNEFTLMAWECRQHLGYHINSENVVMEFLDDGEEVSHGERGEVVCTSLINQAMPFIRYRLGDIGIPSKEPCPCGRTLPLMKVVEGRSDDFLVTLDGKMVSPLIFFPFPFKDFEWIRQFRIIQESRDKLAVHLVAKEGSKDITEILAGARQELVRLFGTEMHVEFNMLASIDRDSSGKLRKIISHVSNDDIFRKSESVGLFYQKTCLDSAVKRK